jgi:predicted metal-binding protein
LADPTTIFVCTTCRRGTETLEPAEERSGAKLFARLKEAAKDRSDLQILGVECLLNCTGGCNIALRCDGKWSYHFGDLDPELQLANILKIATMHNLAADGEVPWGKRPEEIKRKAVSRIPPLPQPSPAAAPASQKA